MNGSMQARDRGYRGGNSGGQSRSAGAVPRAIRLVSRTSHLHQYTLACSPLNPVLDGTFRKITVTVNAPGRPKVRSRNGYYANASVKK